MSLWLGVDCGGTFLKAALFDDRGRTQGLARSALTVISDQPGRAERDMDELWRAACAVIGDVIRKAGVDPAEIAGLGVSAQGKGAFLLDRDRRPLGRAVLSSDQRALETVRAWQAKKIPEALYPTTLQTLWTGHPVSILRWLKDNDPDRYGRIGSVLMGHDYLRFRLTGAVGCEITNISESNLYDMRGGCYDTSLARLLGIEEMMDCLPPIVGSAEVTGAVTAEAAEATGLRAGTPVVGGLFDVVATCLSAGVKDETRINAVLGTWSVVTGFAREIKAGLPIPYVYGRHAEPGAFIVHDASPTSAANLEWLTRELGERNYAGVDSAVEAITPASTGVLFLPFLYGSNAGLGMRGGFYGLQALHGRAHLIQAVYEGVVFSLLNHLEKIRGRFPDATALRVTGGPTRSKVWMQMLADASGFAVEIPAVEETSALGAALSAAVGVGAFPDYWRAMEAVESAATVIEPIRERRVAYDAKRGAYRELVAALRTFEDKMASLDKGTP